MNGQRQFDRAVSRVVAARNCSGCGACALLDPGVSMQLDVDGYLRPVRVLDGTSTVDTVATFEAVCPGRRVRSPRPAGATIHPTLGPILSAWSAWAADADIRHRGSSGGTLTALVTWLTETGEFASFVAAQAAARSTRTETVTIIDREGAMASAGSRYAPTAILAHPGVLAPGTGVVGKPCEVSAARALAGRDSGAETPLMLSFFCAGTPSQQATDDLVTELGLPDLSSVEELWYRGRGWPGRFTVCDRAGREVSASYDDSWGKHLGPTTQWRCKICPDGVGESADISAADFWKTDERGYPDFTDGAGCSALLARTPRGQDVLDRAFAAGVIIGHRIDPDELARVQPLQVSRRSSLLGRLVGTRAAGRRIPRYRGFGLARLALGNPRQAIRTARGSFRRVRAAR